MKKLMQILAIWLPIAVVTTALCGLVYLTVQQSLRQTANDPQIQMAEDAAASLARGDAPEAVLPHSHVDIARSLAPFMVVFDADGVVLAESGLLRGQRLHLPDGVLENVRRHGESRLTLQPAPDVRIASVIAEFGGPSTGFVLAGRSLREVEVRERQTEVFAGVAWIAGMIVSLVATSIVTSLTIWQ